MTVNSQDWTAFKNELINLSQKAEAVGYPKTLCKALNPLAEVENTSWNILTSKLLR
jgi:hypothetical protein